MLIKNDKEYLKKRKPFSMWKKDTKICYEIKITGRGEKSKWHNRR